MSDHQDWNTVYIGAQKHLKTESKKKSPKSSAPPKSSHKERKMDDKVEEGEMRTKTFDAAFGKRVQAYRQSQSLKQKELAQKLRVNEKIVKDLEAGKAKYNPSLMSKLKRLMA
jgi:ribosome-binding protein aMBF1 (putative translation factor)